MRRWVCMCVIQIINFMDIACTLLNLHKEDSRDA